MYLKTNNLLQPILHGVNIRNAQNNFIINRSKKTYLADISK
jgi:hypothetical protein